MVRKRLICNRRQPTQNARAALQISEYGYVLETGELALEGPAVDLAQNPRVIETYLGLTKKVA